MMAKRPYRQTEGQSLVRRGVMAELTVHQFMCLKDNFGVLVHDLESGLTAAIDTIMPITRPGTSS